MDARMVVRSLFQDDTFASIIGKLHSLWKLEKLNGQQKYGMAKTVRFNCSKLPFIAETTIRTTR